MTYSIWNDTKNDLAAQQTWIRQTCADLPDLARWRRAAPVS
ncbi:hypothetical protein [Paenibacillus hemerocallicola]|nr:hypothetical protein [Paenibacillus hemerocallicola]